jgi:hypothetical protein
MQDSPSYLAWVNSISAGEHVAGRIADFQFVHRRRRLAVRNIAQQLLEGLYVRRGHEVEQRHALDVLEFVVAEHLEVGGVGANVHPLVDVGDRVARGFDQRIATAFGLADLGLEPAHAATRLEVVEFPRHHHLQVEELAAQHDPAGARLGQRDEVGIVDMVDLDHHGQVTTGGGCFVQDVAVRHLRARRCRQHHVEGMRGQVLLHFVDAGGPGRPDGEA